MLQRIAGAATPEEFAALKTLADVLEPVKDYTRERTAPAEPTSQMPLNRMVDAVALESDTARYFSELVDRFIASSCHDLSIASALRNQLLKWSQNDAAFSSLAQKSFLASEAAATSRDLAALGTAGLAALDTIASSSALTMDNEAISMSFMQALAATGKQAEVDVVVVVVWFAVVSALMVK